VKHLSEINVIPDPLDNFWTNPAYRIPDTPDGCIEPGTTPAKTVPIGKLTIRSFLTSHEEGGPLARKGARLRGIAFTSGSPLTKVEVSDDDGQTWKPAKLGADLGRYSFREWTLDYQPPAKKGTTEAAILCRATAQSGETQPLKAGWNPPGYLRNVVERVKLKLV
jgi:hypothetical protein